MSVAPREKFGIGSSFKKFVRKVIPNEVSEVAVKAAPFVAPFNPAAAAAMAGIGSFDQTGSISDAIKRGGLTYAGGQAARYIGGADFQQNPFTSGGAFTAEGFKSGFSSPIGTKTGLGKFFSQQGAPVQEVQGAQEIGQKAADQAMVTQANTLEGLPVEGADPGVFVKQEAFPSVDAFPSAGNIDPGVIVPQPKPTPSFFEAVKTGNVEQIGKSAFDLAKKAGNQIFLDENGRLDKQVALASLAFAASYAEAAAAADELGIEDYTEAQYDEAQKTTKKKQYAKNLENFFTGRKDGGRIGYKDGTEKEGIKVDTMGDMSEEDMIMFRNMKNTLIEKILRDRPGSASNIIEALNPFDDKDVDIRGGAFRREQYSKELDDLINNMIATKDKPEERSNFIRRFERRHNYRNGTEKEGILSVTDEGRSGVMYYDDKGNPLTKEEFLEQADAEEFKIRDQLDFVTRNKNLFEPETYKRINRELMEKLFGGAPDIKLNEEGYNLMDRTNQKNGTDKKGLDIDIEVEKELQEETPQAYPFMIGTSPITHLRRFLKKKEIKNKKTEKKATGGRTGYMMGSEVPVRKNQGGVMELDYRDTGGFVPVGIKERADDVPAMLSKNEFVLTADAVRGIGNGDVDQGARTLYNMMKQAEKVGKA